MRRTLLLLSGIVLVAGAAAIAGLAGPPSPPPPPPIPVGPLIAPLTGADLARFTRGRDLFNKDFRIGEGVGPVFNADSCRACHQDPFLGGAGGVDVQVQRPAISDGEGGFMPPPETGGLAQTHAIPGVAREEIPDTVVFVERRNSPTLLGLGRVEQITEAAIIANEDLTDADEDGIFGIAHRLPGGGVGRLGWRANVPNLLAFVRDAMGNEMGITVPATANPFGILDDVDGALDPELSNEEIDDVVFFLQQLDFVALGAANATTLQGSQLFEQIGCATCHTPVLDGVELYSNLLLHDVQPDDFVGITQGQATEGLYRTAPLRGLRDTAPYFHDGRSDTIEQAVRRHDGEARTVREAFEALTPAEQAALLAFLESL